MKADPALLRRAALLATGADVHRVNGLCHAYRLLCGAAGRGDAAAIGQAREAERRLRVWVRKRKERVA